MCCHLRYLLKQCNNDRPSGVLYDPYDIKSCKHASAWIDLVPLIGRPEGLGFDPIGFQAERSRSVQFAVVRGNHSEPLNKDRLSSVRCLRVCLMSYNVI